MSAPSALSQVPQTTSAPVASASAPRRHSMRAQSIHVVIPSSATLARLVTPTVTGGHGHGGSSIPTEDGLLSTPLTTPGHGHPGAQMFAVLPSPAGYASPLITMEGYGSPVIGPQGRMSARASRRSSMFSASSAVDDRAHPFADGAVVAAGALAPAAEECEDGEAAHDHGHDGDDSHMEDPHMRCSGDAGDQEGPLRGTA
ncbi:hypothetical protein BC628DRAFT_152343 [Trametes gibbosa]|nr:hypothetical protein BC628DRAFT_152343 [Trametes gibbosa]